MSLLAPDSQQWLDKKVEQWIPPIINELTGWLKYFIDKTSIRTRNTLEDKYNEIEFNIEDNLKYFEKKLELFFDIISQNSIWSNEELERVTNLFNDLCDYIINNKDNIIQWYSQTRVWIIMFLNDIQAILIDRIDFARYKMDTNIKNTKARQIKKQYEIAYNLIIPTNYSKLPDNYNNDKIFNKLKNYNWNELLVNWEFNSTIIDLKKYFEQIIVNNWDNIKWLTYHQLNELLIRVNKLSALIIYLINQFNEKNWDDQNYKNKKDTLSFIDKQFIWRSKDIIKVRILNYDISSAIKDNWLSDTSNEKKEILSNNIYEFWNFINSFRELKRIIIKNWHNIWKLEIDTLKDLYNTIINVKKILKYIIDKNIENKLTPTTYNSQIEYDKINNLIRFLPL